MKKILSIAGSDCSGGAGIQADIKTITVHKMYAMSVITALTAQNTTGVSSIYGVSPDFVAQQLDMIFTDIYPDAVKIGMLSESETIEVIADKLKEYKVKNVVLDPVMISTSGSRLLKEEAVHMLLQRLLPLADIITPNIPEAEVLSQITIETKEDMIRAAGIIGNIYDGHILIKGGHNEVNCDDLLYFNGTSNWFVQEKINNPNTHGTGCTLSSAIACRLAERKKMSDCVREAKVYITGALEAGLNLGHGDGPLDHGWCLVK